MTRRSLDLTKISRGSVYVQLEGVEGSRPLHDVFRGWLSAEEERRADKFVFEADRSRFLVAHGRLREGLGRLTGLAPERIVFGERQRGKPVIANPGFEDLRFNIAHSGDLVALAYAWGMEVGVDVEHESAGRKCDMIVSDFFSESEKAHYYQLDEYRRGWAFCEAWTRKEAFIKATGQGLYLPLDAFSVPLGDFAPGAIAVHDRVSIAGTWWLQEIDTGDEDYAGALVTEGQAAKVVYIDRRSWADRPKPRESALAVADAW